MTDQYYAPAEPGRAAAFIAYALYILSIPSAGVLALVGVIVAYVGRDDAGPIARGHLEEAIRIWWIAFWWGVAIAIAAIISGLLTFVLIGFPLLWVVGVVGFIVMAWFTIVSVFGVIKLLDGRPVR